MTPVSGTKTIDRFDLYVMDSFRQLLKRLGACQADANKLLLQIRVKPCGLLRQLAPNSYEPQSNGISIRGGFRVRFSVANVGLSVLGSSAC